MGATGYRQQSEIWHGASFDTLIKIQEGSFEGPGFGNKVVTFGPFLGILIHDG